MAKPPPDPLYTFRENMSPVHSLLVIIKEDNELLYAGTNKGYVHVWDLKMKRQITFHQVGSEPCLSVLYHNDRFITQLKSDSIKFWNEENNSWKLLKVFKNDYCGFCTITILDDLIFLPDDERRIIIYDFAKNKETIVEEKKDLGFLMCLKSIKSLDGIIAVYESGDLHYCSKTLEVLHSCKFSSECPMAIDVCEATKEGILGTAADKFFKFKICQTKRVIDKTCEITLTNPGVGSVSINKEGTLCALGCWDGRIRYYSMKKMKLLAVLIHHTDAVQCITFVNRKLSFCPPGLVFLDLIIAGGKDNRISLWNLYT